MKKNLSLKQKNLIAQKHQDELIKWKNIASFSFLHIGRELKEIKDNKLYRYLGVDSPEYESFENYIASSDINMDLRKVYYLIQIYDTFILKYGYKPEDLKGIYWTSLRSLLPVINEHNVKDLVGKARTLTRTHLDIEIKQLKAGLTSSEDLVCKHSEIHKITFYKCQKCHERFKIQPPNSEITKED